MNKKKISSCLCKIKSGLIEGLRALDKIGNELVDEADKPPYTEFTEGGDLFDLVEDIGILYTEIENVIGHINEIEILGLDPKGKQNEVNA